MTARWPALGCIVSRSVTLDIDSLRGQSSGSQGMKTVTVHPFLLPYMYVVVTLHELVELPH